MNVQGSAAEQYAQAQGAPAGGYAAAVPQAGGASNGKGNGKKSNGAAAPQPVPAPANGGGYFAGWFLDGNHA